MIRDLRNAAMGTEVPLFAKGARGATGARTRAARRLARHAGRPEDERRIEARLFGQPAMTATALAAIALRQRCPVIPGRIERIGPARLRLVVDAPIALPDSGDRMTDQAVLTQRINDTIEGWIRARPES